MPFLFANLPRQVFSLPGPIDRKRFLCNTFYQTSLKIISLVDVRITSNLHLLFYNKQELFPFISISEMSNRLQCINVLNTCSIHLLYLIRFDAKYPISTVICISFAVE